MPDLESSAVARYGVSSSDPDVALEAMRAAYTQFDLRPVRREAFEFSLDGVAVGPVEVSTLRHSAPIVSEAERPERYLAIVSLGDTRSRLLSGREDARGPVLLAPSSEFSCEYHDCHVLVAAVDPLEVARVAADMTGIDPGAVTFHSMRPRSEALGRYWAALVTHLQQDVLAHDEMLASPLLRAEAVSRIARGLLTVFPNNALDHRRVGGRDDGAPATVRRAMEFIDANARRDIDVGRIAEAAGLGVRGLQAAFRRHRDQTPLDYLRRVRMQGAHRDLQAGDPTRSDTVAAIALRWGFTHPGRFSVDYRRTHGCSPSETLRG